MSRTLADMTPDERQACVGLWCDNLASAAKEPAPVVLACVQGDLCWVLHTDLHGEWSCFPLDRVAPRPDLMRAWNPDGTAPDGSWQHSSAELPLPDYSGTYTQHYRRWESDWEATDE